MRFFILLAYKKIMDTGVLDFYDKKLILDYYFCLKSSPVFLFQIFIMALLPHKGRPFCNVLLDAKLAFDVMVLLMLMRKIYLVGVHLST
jgi:hypothetical protein